MEGYRATALVSAKRDSSRRRRGVRYKYPVGRARVCTHPASRVQHKEPSTHLRRDAARRTAFRLTLWCDNVASTACANKCVFC